MKTLSERIAWYKAPELRKRKRVWHCCELMFVSLSAIAIIVVILLNGNGTKLQPLLVLFTAVIGLISACLAVFFYRLSEMPRWLLQMTTLSLFCSVGIAAVAAFTVLELQVVST